MNFAHPVKAGDFLIQDPGQQHQAVSFKTEITVHRGLANRTLVEQRLSHNQNLAVCRRTSQRFFVGRVGLFLTLKTVQF